MSETSASIAGGQLRAFFERWSRLEEEKQNISYDLKELFAEVKGVGFDTKAARVVFREKLKLGNEDAGDTAKREEFDTICDLYRAALEGPRAHPAHSARENIEKFDAETGEIKDEPAAAADTAGDYSRKPMAAASGRIIREGDAPRETDRFGGDASRPDTNSEMDRAEVSGISGQLVAAEKGREAIPARPEGADLSHAGADESSATGDVTPPASPVTIHEDEVPAFLKKPSKPLRPHCQNPDVCAGVGHKHCYSCTKAAGLVEVAA